MGDVVSVVMPCFNAAPYLRAAIESVLRQDYRPLELIVVDDGSSDDSAAVARTFGDDIVFVEQEHRGAAAARNVAVRRARGPYLAFCDADDVWPAESLTARMQVLVQDPRIDYVFGLVHNFVSPEADAERVRRLSFPTGPVAGRVLGALVVRRLAFERVGPFSEACEIGEALEWLGRAAEAGVRGDAIDRVVLQRRIHGANSTLRSASPPRQYLRILKTSLDRRRGQDA